MRKSTYTVIFDFRMIYTIIQMHFIDYMGIYMSILSIFTRIFGIFVEPHGKNVTFLQLRVTNYRVKPGPAGWDA